MGSTIQLLRLVACVAVAGAPLAAAARADVPTTTATVVAATTTTAPTTTTVGATTTTTTTTPAPTTTAAATTTTSSPTTTTVSPTTAPSRAPAAATAATTITEHPLGRGCPITAVALLVPGRTADLIGPFAEAPDDQAALTRLAYGAIVSGSDISLSQKTCTARGPIGASTRIASLSLFGGAVTATQVSATIGLPSAITVSGLRIAGRPVSSTPGSRNALQGWGRVVVGNGRPSSGTGGAIAGLAVELLHAHDGLPAGTMLLVSVAGVPVASHRPAHSATRVPRRHAHHRLRAHRPLTVTPPLGDGRYVFPVAGTAASFGDTYGGFRNDVAGNWHHGDDIFAPLGTPVVAAASGTVNRVGWNEVGGWRLWVRDDVGDEFYYAHLSGYTAAVLHSKRVRAGEVIGFVGNTGDAFTTAAHLHFEIHPRPLLHLGYDGAVDPTGYLDRWHHLDRAATPRPALPVLPAQAVLRHEARYVWRELLVARHLAPRRPAHHVVLHVRVSATTEAPPARQADAATAPSAAPTESGSSRTALLVNLVAAVALLAIAAIAVAAAAPHLGRRS